MEGIPEKECLADEMQGWRVAGIVAFEKVVFCVYDENVQCVCLSPIVLADEWGWLNRGSAFSPGDIPVKRLLCLGVRVIDILPASLSPHNFSIPLLFSLSILDILSLLNCCFLSIFPI